VRLFRTVVVRHLLAERLRSVTTVVAIAMGIAVIVAVRLTNASSVGGFRAAVELVSGRTSLEIVGVSGGFDEVLLGDLDWLRDFGDVSPLIDGEVVALPRRAGADPVRLRLLGVDVLREPPFRQYELAGADLAPGTPGFLGLLLDARAVILTERFAREHGVTNGDVLRLAVGDAVGEFTVRGLLRDEGPARVLDGHFVLMDIAAAQLAVNRLGRIDRLDVRLTPGLDLAMAAREIAGRLPPGILVQEPAARTRQAERMLQAFQLNLEALSYVALLVGLFLIYNTVSVSVIARREEIGVLRALGVRRGIVRALFLGEAAVLGAAGCLLGLGVGRLLAHAAIDLTTSTVQTLYVAAAAAPPELTLAEAAFACAVGLPLALLAAVVPANEAAGVPPVAAIRDREDAGGEGRSERFGRIPGPIVALTLLAAAIWMARQPPIDGRPVLGWGAAVSLVLGVACLVPAVLTSATRIVSRILGRVFHLESWLANANLSAGIGRIAISIAALAMSLAMLVAIAVMVGSFRVTVQYWVEQTLKADVYVSAPARPAAQPDFTISSEVEDAVRAHPGVLAVDPFRRDEGLYDESAVALGAGDYAVLLAHGNLLFKAPANADEARNAMREAAGRDLVVVSEPFAVRHGRRVGDRLELMTPAGPAEFGIAAIYFDYSSDRGVITFDWPTFTRHFGERRPTSLSVYLRPGESPDRVREQLEARLDGAHRLIVRTNESLRQEVLRIFDSTFAITYALEAVAIVIAVMGVATTLLTLILDRRREIAVLRLLGASRRQVTGMMVAEAVFIGGVSQAIGLLAGLALSLILVFVINLQSFGWTIQWHMPWAFLAQASLLTLAATVAAGLLPARRAARLEWTEQLSES